MAIFKTISEKLRLALMIVTIVSLVYVAGWAVINRITGGNCLPRQRIRNIRNWTGYRLCHYRAQSENHQRFGDGRYRRIERFFCQSL